MNQVTFWLFQVWLLVKKVTIFRKNLEIDNLPYKTTERQNKELKYHQKQFDEEARAERNQRLRTENEELVAERNALLALRQSHEGRKRHLWRPHFSKGLTKLAILRDYERSGMLCLALPARLKVRKLDFQSEFSISKIIRIFLNFFSWKNSRFCTHFLLR